MPRSSERSWRHRWVFEPTLACLAKYRSWRHTMSAERTPTRRSSILALLCPPPTRCSSRLKPPAQWHNQRKCQPRPKSRPRTPTSFFSPRVRGLRQASCSALLASRAVAIRRSSSPVLQCQGTALSPIPRSSFSSTSEGSHHRHDRYIPTGSGASLRAPKRSFTAFRVQLRRGGASSRSRTPSNNSGSAKNEAFRNLAS